MGVCVNLLLGFKSTCTQTNKHTNQPVKKRSSTFLKRSFSKTVEFLLHFPSCDIYILWLWGVERLPKAWCIMTGPGSQLLLLHVLSCLFSPLSFFALDFSYCSPHYQSQWNHLRITFVIIFSQCQAE